MSITPEEEHKRVIAGLQLLRNEPKGLGPNKSDIVLWVEGSLATERAEEVASWVANHPGYNQIWLDIIAELHGRQGAQPEKTEDAPVIQSIPGTAMPRSWMQQLLDLSRSQMLSGALAAGLLAVFVVPAMLQQASTQVLIDESYGLYGSAWDEVVPPAIEPKQSKGLKDFLRSAVVQDYAAYHIRYGFGRFIERSPAIQKTNWRAFGNALPAEFLSCSASSIGSDNIEKCELAANFFADLGEWSLMTYSVCTDDSQADSDKFWGQQQQIVTQLQESFSEVEVSKMDKSMRHFSKTSLQTKSSMCMFSKKLVSRYL